MHSSWFKGTAVSGVFSVSAFNWHHLFTEVLQGMDTADGVTFLVKLHLGILLQLRYFYHPVLLSHMATAGFPQKERPRRGRL